MKIEWTSTTPSVAKVTLGDDSSKHTIMLEEMAFSSMVQVSPLFRATNPLCLSRGNAAGSVGFTAQKSHASRDAAASFCAGENGRLNQIGSLVLTFTSHTLTFASALLTEVQAVQLNGVRWAIRYRFEVKTMTLQAFARIRRTAAAAARKHDQK